MMKTWCKHLKYKYGISENRFEADLKDWAGARHWIPVPRSWKCCPICGAERPTKANIAAAVNRALQDGEQ